MYLVSPAIEVWRWAHGQGELGAIAHNTLDPVALVLCWPSWIGEGLVSSLLDCQRVVSDEELMCSPLESFWPSHPWPETWFLLQACYGYRMLTIIPLLVTDIKFEVDV